MAQEGFQQFMNNIEPGLVYAKICNEAISEWSHCLNRAQE
jgi:hypothetical protein